MEMRKMFRRVLSGRMDRRVGFFLLVLVVYVISSEMRIKLHDQKWRSKLQFLEQEWQGKLDAVNKEWENKFEQRVEKEVDKKLKDAIKHSTSIRVGKYIENLVPLMADFKHDPRDIRWGGDPLDMIILEGYGSAKDTGDWKRFNQIIFCEIKTGKSKLEDAEKRVKELIEQRKVTWKEFRVKRE